MRTHFMWHHDSHNLLYKGSGRSTGVSLAAHRPVPANHVKCIQSAVFSHWTICRVQTDWCKPKVTSLRSNLRYCAAIVMLFLLFFNCRLGSSKLPWRVKTLVFWQLLSRGV